MTPGRVIYREPKPNQPYVPPQTARKEPFLYRVANYTLSIEWANLRLHKRKSVEIYGEIKAECSFIGKCLYVYHRHWNQAQTVPEDAGDGLYLTLCGPNECLHSSYTEELEVNLFEKGGKPLIDGTFYAGEREKLNEPFVLAIENEECTLSICFYRIDHSIETLLRFLVVNADAENTAETGDFTITGSIKAERGGAGPQPRQLTLFESQSGVKVPYGKGIPLPREIFILPVQRWKEEEAGTGSFLTVKIDLGMVHEKDKKSYLLEGQAKIVLRDGDILTDPQFITFGNSSRKRKQDSCSTEAELSTTDPHSDEFKIRLSVWTFYSGLTEGEDDVLNHENPLST